MVKIDEDRESPIYGDILEYILSRVSLVDLVPASHVSREWRLAVSSSLRHLNPPKPWLFVHAQGTRSPYATATLAYDPRSHVWMKVDRPAIKHVSALRSAHSGVLYMLSLSRLTFSSDPLHLTWHNADAPFVWRADPIVALVGGKVVVAGGGCDFEDDPLAVEIFDVRTRAWDSCESMPAVLKDSAASTWLSVATDDEILFVTERQSGATHTFNPESKTWSGPHDLRPDPTVCCSIITFSGERLILIGLLGDVENVRALKLWSVNPQNFEREEIGEMPKAIFEKLKSQSFQISSISACSAANWVYIYNPSQIGNVYVCELGIGGCRWRSEKIPMANDRSSLERVAFTCSNVGIEDVDEALRSENWECTPCK